MSDLDVYREAYRRFLDAGDDPINARCRILDMGATIEEANAIEVLEPDEEDE